MRTVSLVQVNFQQGPTHCVSFYLPYSVGCLWSYANSFDYVNQNYQLDQVIWRRDPIQTIATRLANNDIVALSTYVWNRNYNYELARQIKSINPACFLLFGGPEPAIQDPDLFVKSPFMDAVIVLEGEKTFKDFLCNFDNLQTVPGLVINHGGRSIKTGEPKRIDDLEELPSPYLTGFFDRLILENTDVKEWTATIETNRGCPYQCTFCDWGSLTYNKVKKVSLDRVFAELEWAAKNRCTWIAFTDANFGMFVERDNAILDKFLDLQQSVGYPHGYSVSYAKNQKKDVLDMITKVIKKSTHMTPGLRVSLQTLTEPVLDIVKRKNLQQENCEEIFALAEQKNVPVGTEMILGLPGETLASWKNNMWRLFDMGLHSAIDIFFCQLLENSEMNLVQRQIYDIQTVGISDYIISNYDDGDVTETVQVVTSTSTMTHDDLVDAAIFNWFISTCHFHGLTNFSSRFLRKYSNLAYADFYNDLFDQALLDSWFDQEVQEYKMLLHEWYTTGRIDNYSVCQVNLSSWNIPNKTILKLHSNDQLRQHVFDFLDNHMLRYNLDPDIYQDLIHLQHHYPIQYSALDHYPKKIPFHTNIYDYIVKDEILTPVDTELLFTFPETKPGNLQEFLERIYFTRGRKYGQARILDISNMPIPK